MTNIAVVILNWNGKKLLEQFLPSVVKYSPEATIYVADNASTDDSVAFINTHYPSVKIIQNTGNFGYAKGYNEALQHVDEEIFALVNSDIEVTEGWLQPILQTFENEQNAAVIQPKILDYKNKKMFEYAGAGGGFIDSLGFPFCRGRIFQELEEDKGQFNDELEVFWASGACFFIRKDIFLKMNGFDAYFFAHQEEIDLCWRVKNEGFAIKYNGKSTVYHVGGATLSNQHPKKTFLNFRNSLFMLVKNLPSSKLFHTIFIRLCLDGLAGIYFVFQGKHKHTLAIIRAHFSFYGKLFYYLNKRTTSQIKEYYKIKSIVWSHYGKKINTYLYLFSK